MLKRILLNIQRKQLHDILFQHDVDPALCKWTNDGKDWTNRAETLEVGLCHFVFSPDSDGTLSAHYKPTIDGGVARGVVNKSWDGVLSLFDAWARMVKRELEQEDPWQQYSIYVPPEQLGGRHDNSPFTHQEAEHAYGAVLAFRLRVKKLLPQYADVADQFDPQFDRLSEQAKKGAGRVDWSNQLVGMLISLCIALSLEPEKASVLWRTWLELIHQFFLPGR